MSGKLVRLGVALLLGMVLAGCATALKTADTYAAQDEWLKAVLEYRKAYAAHPTDIEFKSRLQQAELKAADFYYKRGIQLLEQNNLDGAIGQFQDGLVCMPDHQKLQQAITDVTARKQADTLVAEAISLRDGGKIPDAIRKLRAALDVYPSHHAATTTLAALEQSREEQASKGLALASTAPITLNFRQTDLRQAFDFLAKSFGVNIIYDEGVKSAPVTLMAKGVTFDQGLNLLLATTRMFSKRIGPNTILIAADNKEKRGQYEDHMVRNFQLNVVRAKDMADIVKGLVSVKKIIINEELNTLLVRDTEDVIQLVQRIIDSNDRKPAEIILDVEILEVNRTKAEKLGLDLNSYSVTASLPPPFTVPVTGSIRDAITNNAVMTIPAATLRLYKQDIDAQVLANPKIRVMSGKSAKIHIGDRVPLRAATIIDATGQTRTTFEYKDIGIRLSVEPTINLDNSALVKLGLEVSALGENLGTVDEPAYRIGTRNADTVMLLRDGETAILGGLIRDEERNTRLKVPGLGDIPVVGSLFTSYDNAGGRTDVLLTITPRVVRGWEAQSRASQEFYSGTETLYRNAPVLTGLQVSDANDEISVEGQSAQSLEAGGSEVGGAAGTGGGAGGDARGNAAGSAVGNDAALNPPPTSANPPAAEAAATEADAAEAESRIPMLQFAEPVYEVSSGQEIEVEVRGSYLPAGARIPIQILYNPQLLSFVSADQGGMTLRSFNASADSARGLITLTLETATQGGTSGEGVSIAHMKLKGDKSGISYLVYRASTIKTTNGADVSAQVRASRVVVK
jgi:general secretion pathway protein D